MSDLLVGLVGVVVGGLLTGGTSVYMARRRDKRDARAAQRIIETELKEADQAVRSALEFEEWPAGWTKRFWSESWKTYRPALALDIRNDEHFFKLATAYLDLSLLETGLAAGKRPFVPDDRTFLTDASRHLNDAITALSHGDLLSVWVQYRVRPGPPVLVMLQAPNPPKKQYTFKDSKGGEIKAELLPDEIKAKLLPEMKDKAPIYVQVGMPPAPPEPA